MAEFPIVLENPNAAAIGRTLEYQPVFTDWSDDIEAVRDWGDVPEECEGSIFWALYVREPNGLARHVGDYKSREETEETIRLLFGLQCPAPVSVPPFTLSNEETSC